MKNILNTILLVSLFCAAIACGTNNPEEVPGAIDSMEMHTPDNTRTNADSTIIISDSTGSTPAADNR